MTINILYFYINILRHCVATLKEKSFGIFMRIYVEYSGRKHYLDGTEYI